MGSLFCLLLPEDLFGGALPPEVSCEEYGIPLTPIIYHLTPNT